MFTFPTLPEVPPDQRSAATTLPRYEDIAQDGRATLLALPHAFGAAVWQTRLATHPATRQAAHLGIVPVLTRLVLEGGGGPLSVRKPISVDGGFQLAHTADAEGKIDRLILNIWVSLTGAIGRTQGPPPPRAGEPVFVGRAFGEHVFTRLLAPPEQRKVLSFDLEGVPPVPPDRYVWRPAEELLALPLDAEPLDDALVPDDAPLAFGLHHTDSNQHVNSLVYPRLFEDAALRRFAARGKSTRILARWAEIAYRKPCFANDRMRIHLRAFEHEGRLGAVGAYLRDGDPPGARPFCTVRMLFS